MGRAMNYDDIINELLIMYSSPEELISDLDIDTEDLVDLLLPTYRDELVNLIMQREDYLG